MDAAQNYVGEGCKDNQFSVIINNGRKKFECRLCGRHLSTKHTVLYHLHSAHDMSPLKRFKKKYIDDPSLDIPRSTWHRRKLASKKNEDKQSAVKNEGDLGIMSDHAEQHVNTGGGLCMTENEEHAVPQCSNFDMTYNGKVCEVDMVVEDIQTSEGDIHYTYQGMDSTFNNELWSETSDSSIVKSKLSMSREDIPDSVSSECSEGLAFSEDFSDSSEEISDSSEEISDSSKEFSDSSFSSEFVKDSASRISNSEDNEMKILSCFLRNNLTASSCKDILSTMKSVFPDCTPLQNISYESLWKLFDSDSPKEIHYCIECEEIFPDERNITNCTTARCNGLRYKGSNQMNKTRVPRASFVMANVKRQLKNLLESPGIWSDILKTKSLAKERNKERHEGSDILTDIMDGTVYRSLTKDGGFLERVCNNNLTAVFNTDGVSLYSSSKIQLWPIFLAINELSPRARFARENMILAGIWQGKGKPPFKSYFKAFASQMNDLYDNGISVSVEEEDLNIRLLCICGTFDLPAKSSVLNMIQYNGRECCIACEDPGQVVRQGKGHSLYFSHKTEQHKFNSRNSDQVVDAMRKASEKNKVKGFKGLSGLADLKNFDLVCGVPPDYMHCVLLGVTKSLMYKWFSPTQSKQEYFVGNKLKQVALRLKNIKPPECMERLPRDLESNFSNLKATELQAWLLYYSLPCLIGILEDKYLNHLAMLSEGIYLLLGDSITCQQLDRAKYLLDLFFSQFSDLYSEGSCGLNVHNIGNHLVEYVKCLGPLWCWSCFPFEDCNSMLTKAAHGTGNVTNQLMKIKEAQALLRNNLRLNSKETVWKNLKKANNCELAGAISSLLEDDYCQQVLERFGTNNKSEICKISRIMLNGKKFYSSSYSRMKRRICSAFLTTSGKVVEVKYYVMTRSCNTVFAVVVPAVPMSSSYFGTLVPAGKHLIPVKKGNTCEIIEVNKLVESLWFIDVNDINSVFVAKTANVHGHSVFK